MSPILQQWAGIVVVSAGFGLVWLPLGVIVAGILILAGGVGRELEQRRGG